MTRADSRFAVMGASPGIGGDHRGLGRGFPAGGHGHSAARAVRAAGVVARAAQAPGGGLSCSLQIGSQPVDPPGATPAKLLLMPRGAGRPPPRRAPGRLAGTPASSPPLPWPTREGRTTNHTQRAHGRAHVGHGLRAPVLVPYQIVIHQWGWTLVLNPDGTTTAWNKDKTKTLHSHGPPVRPG